MTRVVRVLHLLALQSLSLPSPAAAEPGDLVEILPSPCIGPMDIAYDADDDTYWVSSTVEYHICHLSRDLKALISTAPLPFTNSTAASAAGLVVRESAGTLFIADAVRGNIHEVEKDGTPTQLVIKVPFQPGVTSRTLGGLAFHADGDHGQGSLYVALREEAIVYEVTLGGEILRGFPGRKDLDKALGAATSKSISDVDLILDGTAVTGFYVVAPSAISLYTALPLDADGKWTGASVSLAAAGGEISGLLRRPFPHPTTGQLIDAYVCTVSAGSRLAVLQGGLSSFRDLSDLSCNASGRDATLTWTRGQSYDAIEVRRGCEVLATLPGDADSWHGSALPDGVYDLTARAWEGANAADAGPCTVTIGTGGILRSVPIEDLESLDEGSGITADADGSVVVLAAPEHALRFFDAGLAFRRSAPISEVLAAPDDPLRGLAAGSEPRTYYTFNQATRTLGKLSDTGELLDTLAPQIPEGSVTALAFRPGPPGQGTLLLLEVPRDTHENRLFELGLDGAVVSTVLHPFSALAHAPKECDLEPVQLGLSLAGAEHPGEVCLAGADIATHPERAAFRMDLATGEIVRGSEIPARAAYRHLDHELVSSGGRPRLLVLGTEQGSYSPRIFELDAGAPAVPPPSFLSARQKAPPRDVDLTFRNNGPYDSIEVLRDCVKVADIDGAAEAFTDRGVPAGPHEYRVRGKGAGGTSAPARAAVRAGPGAVLERAFTCPLQGASEIARDAADGSFFVSGDPLSEPQRVWHFGPALDFLDDRETRLQAPYQVRSLTVRSAPGEERSLYILFREGDVGRHYVLAREAMDGVQHAEWDVEPPTGPTGASDAHGLVWEPRTDTFFLQDRFTDTFAQIDPSGGTLATFPHPAPPANFLARDLGATAVTDRGTILVLGSNVKDRSVSRILEMRVDGTLTGLEISIPTEETGADVTGIAWAEGDIVAVSSNELLRIRGFEDPPPPDAAFVRGNANGDARIDLSDPVRVLNFLFLGGPAPPCTDAADGNDDGKLDLTDAVYVLAHLFLGGPPPPAPFPDPGSDPTPDSLSCAEGTG